MAGRPCPSATATAITILPPVDVIIDVRTGKVRTEGPLDEREKERLDERLARRDEAQHEVNHLAGMHWRSRSEKYKALWPDEWHYKQGIFDVINDGLPARYKAKLENGSCHPDASREGKTPREFIEDREKPRSRRKWGGYVNAEIGGFWAESGRTANDQV